MVECTLENVGCVIYFLLNVDEHFCGFVLLSIIEEVDFRLQNQRVLTESSHVTGVNLCHSFPCAKDINRQHKNENSDQSCVDHLDNTRDPKNCCGYSHYI